jgi:glycogen debranching enzyme
MATPAASIRRFTPPAVAITPATDLGGVDVLKHGNLYLLTDPFGDIHPDSRGLGLYEDSTRILSCSILRIDGARPAVLRGDADDGFRGTIQLANPDRRRNPGDKLAGSNALERETLAVTRQRTIGRGLRERLTVANFTEHEVSVAIELVLGVDAADIFEVRGYERHRRGTQEPVAIDRTRATFSYLGLDGVRRLTHVAFPSADVEPTIDDSQGGSLSVRWIRSVTPGAETEVAWTVWAETVSAEEVAESRPAERAAEPFPDPPEVSEADAERAYADWAANSAVINSDNQLFDRLVARGLADLRLLLNDGPEAGQRYVAAGIPWFATLFGRDSILSAYEAVAIHPAIARDTLRVLAAHQATVDDPSRDAEPGKIVHELRVGEMASTGELPFGAYYGSVDATPLWLILLGETYDWTGDDALVDELWPNAMAALDWIDKYGDIDGDGFVEYGRRAERGLVNQGWKDSRDSVRDRLGRTVEGPIALAEVQGYVYDAKRRLARLARRRSETDLADRLEADAEQLRAAFEAAFWVDDLGAYAMALDGRKRQADAMASNQGHALWSGIVAPARAAAVVDRLSSPELDSGWGIRTYAAGQPGYNPLSYHLGSIWPHDNALILAGVKRYGFDQRAASLAGQFFEAGQHFQDNRMPELFCGFDRRLVPVPVPYPVACSPQAWAAAAPLLIVRAMLGLQAHAEQHRLELIQPHLTPWLGKLTITGLRVGGASVDLLVHRWRGSTSVEVLGKSGDLEILIRQ